MADGNTLKQAAESFTRYVHDNGFEVILFEGVSSQTARISFLKTWEKFYPDKPQPTIFSVGDTDLFLESVQKNLFRLTPKWQEFLGRKVLVANEQSYTGKKLVKMKKALESIGFGNVNTGAISYSLSSEDQLRELREKIDYLGPSLPASEVFYGRRKFLIEEISRRRSLGKGMEVIRGSKAKRRKFLNSMEDIRKSIRARLK